ncbi:MAG: hypothetical protein LQ343_000534 [Gyalolechia ehrenbergii]|nr:MAG: hypothetical protein LQ343_000534 [Gyalolechia ehrenbergii]
MLQQEDDERPRGGFFHLPNELFIDILDYFTKAELKGLRLVCSRLREITTPLLFTTAIIAARRCVFDAFVALSNQADISRHVVEIVYDCSSFSSDLAEQYRSAKGPSMEVCRLISSEGRAKYVEAFDEQEEIVAQELAPTIRNAIKQFPQLRRLVYADFTALPYFHWDRIEDLGPAHGMGNPDWRLKKTESSFDSPLFFALYTDLSLRRKCLGLALLLGALSQLDSKAQIADLQIGDGRWSRDEGGVPDILIMALSDQSYGPRSAFESLRKLDITISDTKRNGHLEQKFPRFPHLELLRLVGPMCSPMKERYAPPLRSPTIRFPDYCGEANWPRLKALELKWIGFKMDDLLNFLGSHKNTLHFINLHQLYIDERSMFGSLVRGLRSMYPSLIVEPYKRFQHFPSYETLVVDFTFYDGQATLTNTGICLGSDQSLDDYDEDQVSNYSSDVDQDEGWYEDYSDDSSADQDYDAAEEHQGLIDPL